MCHQLTVAPRTLRAVLQGHHEGRRTLAAWGPAVGRAGSLRGSEGGSATAPSAQSLPVVLGPRRPPATSACAVTLPSPRVSALSSESSGHWIGSAFQRTMTSAHGSAFPKKARF